MKLAIDPRTLLIAGDITRRAFSAAEFEALEPPDCPVCGLPAGVQRIDVTPNREDEIRNGRTYIVGMWDCPRGCDPRTGERRHFSQTFGQDMAGYRFTCSCEGGTERTGLSAAEFGALIRDHPAEGSS